MQDDFTEFLQAPPVYGVRQPNNGWQAGSLKTNPKNDIESKIMQSLDLSGPGQKGAMRFKPVAQKQPKLPQSMQYKPSVNSADWKSLDLKTSDFTTPTRTPAVRQQQYASQAAHALPQSAYLVKHDRNFYQTNVAVLPQNYSQFQGASFMPQAHMNIGHMASNVSQFPGSAANHPQTLLNQTAYAHHQAQFKAPNLQTMPQVSQAALPQAYEPQSHMRGHTKKSNDITLPSWMTKPSEIPGLYKDVLKACATASSFADTSRLYPILVSSQLPKDVLGLIWSAANQSMPGQLTFSEVYIALALIALAQAGDMNLTVRHVVDLSTPPIPRVELVTATTSPKAAANLALVSAGDVSSNSQNLDVEYSEFQKHSNTFPTPPVPQMQSGSPNPNSSLDAGQDFDDFQEFKSSIQSAEPSNKIHTPHSIRPESSTVASQSTHTMVPQYGPMTWPLDNGNEASRVSSMQLPPITDNTGLFSTGIMSGIKKSDSTKSLPVTSKSNVTFKSVSNLSVTNLTSAPEDDFGEFRMNTMISVDKSNTDSIEAVATTGVARDCKLVKGDLMGAPDKYSALRNLFPSVEESKSATSESVEFSDFQSVALDTSAPNLMTDDITDATTRTADNSVGDSVPVNMSSTWAKGDSDSTNSLDLPSLSKTISGFSIGSTSPFSHQGQSACDYTASEDIKDETDSNDDQLYDLNVPISPPVMAKGATLGGQSHVFNELTSQRKISIHSNAYSAHKDSSSSSSSKYYAVSRKISEADSDFGDFSSAPPPIDDAADQNNSEFDFYQGGNSSLVDFDAFGHFEETRQEKKKKEATDNGSNQKEESTAFSEFMKSSSIEQNKTFERVHVDDTSHVKIKDTNADKEGSSFDTNEYNHETAKSESRQDDTEVESVRENSTGIFDQTEHHPVSDQEKAEPTAMSNVDLRNEPDKSQLNRENPTLSKWDLEGDKLKARMEGTNFDPMEVYVEHWGRCLATCKDIIVATGEIFASLNSPSVCREIVNSTRGKEFISCTSEVHGVARRIRKGMESVGMEDNDLVQALKDIEIAWNNVLGFCPYTPSVHKTPEASCKPPPKTDAGINIDDKGAEACNLCLLGADGDGPVGLTYGGNFYHAACANLWLNQVAPILPRLGPPTIS